MIDNIDLTELGFKENILETKDHIVTYVFYDVGRLSIISKKGHGFDNVYIEDYFTEDKFINIIFYITGYKIDYKNKL